MSKKDLEEYWEHLRRCSPGNTPDAWLAQRRRLDQELAAVDSLAFRCIDSARELLVREAKRGPVVGVVQRLLASVRQQETVSLKLYDVLAVACSDMERDVNEINEALLEKKGMS